MAETSFPFDNSPSYEDSWAKMAPGFAESGILLGDTYAAGLWQPNFNSLKVSYTSGLGISVAAGQAIINGFYYENTAARNFTANAGGGSQRWDAIVLRLDRTGNQAYLAYVAGGSTIYAPTKLHLGTTWEVVLCHIKVPAGAASLATATFYDVRPKGDPRKIGLELWATAAQAQTFSNDASTVFFRGQSGEMSSQWGSDQTIFTAPLTGYYDARMVLTLKGITNSYKGQEAYVQTALGTYGHASAGRSTDDNAPTQGIAIAAMPWALAGQQIFFQGLVRGAGATINVQSTADISFSRNGISGQTVNAFTQ